MAYIDFDSSAPGGFLIVDDKSSAINVLIQSDWDYPGVATAIGWQACSCGGTDGTVDCKACGRIVCNMISEAYDYLREHEGECFEALDDYLEESEL